MPAPFFEFKLKSVLVLLTLFAVPCLLDAQGTAAPTPTPAERVSAPAAPPPTAEQLARAPKIIFLMRHAEKPEGDKTDPNLTPSGFQRAEALPSMFLATPGAKPRLPRPDFVFATAMSKHSNRPVETVTPLARALNEPLNHTFTEDDIAGLAHELLSGRYAGKVVVLCWHHGRIPAVAAALGVTNPPAAWNPAVFNQIWQIEYAGGTPRMTILTESLLPGDPGK